MIQIDFKKVDKAHKLLLKAQAALHALDKVAWERISVMEDKLRVSAMASMADADASLQKIIDVQEMMREIEIEEEEEQEEHED